MIYAVNFRSVAANGTTDYYNGLTPTCTQPDTLSQPLAGPGDAMYTSGLARLRTGACPIAVDPRAAPLSIRGAPSAQMPPGLGRVHGNW